MSLVTSWSNLVSQQARQVAIVLVLKGNFPCLFHVLCPFLPRYHTHSSLFPCFEEDILHFFLESNHDKCDKHTLGWRPMILIY